MPENGNNAVGVRPSKAEVDAVERILAEACDGTAPDGYWRHTAEDALEAAKAAQQAEVDTFVSIVGPAFDRALEGRTVVA
jgi:hypothetical protein